MAPLFDQMTTHVKSRRFRAADALVFLEEVIRQLPNSILDKSVDMEPNWVSMEDPTSYWARLPANFSKTWETYQTPPRRRIEIFLRFVAQYDIGWNILTFVRRAFCI